MDADVMLMPERTLSLLLKGASGERIGPRIGAVCEPPGVHDAGTVPFALKKTKNRLGNVSGPPRAGSAEQAERLAQSKVPVIIAVSCNPATLARDARALIDGGYNMGVVTPIDQFIYSPHLEAVAVFKR